MNTSMTGAEFSPCRSWRYALWRRWNISRKMALFICLNPSTADETQDDPTIRRCIGFAKSWDCGGLYIANIFAYRSTDPKALYKIPDPIGADNDFWIKKLSREAKITICGWGTHGNYQDRGSKVLDIIREPHCLGRNKDGSPKHPLYLRADSEIIPMYS